ncbi:hypothetical protein COLO4_08171 [Corchorus olitorius]|uniref:Uncharacterized protein n=1 Tax=Corchorus olitorius TaxID=93759 RepID=A0A1R3KH14_9ROSI|nr:hypothetical protein COLO4_08171 [Corchorus olitorius]
MSCGNCDILGIGMVSCLAACSHPSRSFFNNQDNGLFPGKSILLQLTRTGILAFPDDHLAKIKGLELFVAWLHSLRV